MIHNPLQISKDCQDFKDIKPCGSIAFFSVYNEDKYNKIFCPLLKSRLWTKITKQKYYFFLTYGFKNFKCPFVLSANFLELRCNLEMLQTLA